PAMAVEDLLPRQRDLHGPPGQERELGDHDLVVEGVALPAEPPAVGARDDAHARRREPEHLARRTVEVVRRLRARPDRHAPVRVRAAASNAASSSTAATAATGSPTNRTRSIESACSSCDTGRIPNGTGIDSPVSTATTPGTARAADVSIERMRACATCERWS